MESNATLTFITDRYSNVTAGIIKNWIINHCPNTEAGVMKSSSKKPRVVVVTHDINNIVKIKDYLDTISLV